jgi:hypothetical protein
MSIVDFAKNILKVPLNFYQVELLELLQISGDSAFYSSRPRTHGMLLIHEIYQKYKNADSM